MSLMNNGVLLNYEIVYDYLMSNKSVFPNCTLMDFIETLHVLQFSRSHARKSSDANKVFYNFINPNFQDPLPDDFYKRPIDITNCHMLKGTKRITNLHYIALFDRLIKRSYAQEIPISPLQYAKLRIHYEFDRRNSLRDRTLDEIIHDVEEPEYVKQNEIAGYYGNVSLTALKNGFCNYFPIYQETPQTPQLSAIEEEQEVIQEEVPQQKEAEEMDIDVGTESVTIMQMVPIMNDAMQTEVPEEEQKENARKRKRKPYTKRSAKISKRETEDALMNLQKYY